MAGSDEATGVEPAPGENANSGPEEQATESAATTVIIRNNGTGGGCRSRTRERQRMRIVHRTELVTLHGTALLRPGVWY